MNITTYGMTYLGQAYSAWLADFGHNVCAIGKTTDNDKIEGSLQTLIQKGKDSGKLNFMENIPDVHMIICDVLWVLFDTPINHENNEADVNYVIEQISKIVPLIKDRVLILISSQIPVGTLATIEKRWPNKKFAYIPENVRVGKSLDYLFNLDRIVLGTRRKEDVEIVNRIINLTETDLDPIFMIPIVVMSPESAEMVKHTINSFLGTSISFMNEIASVCKVVGADPMEVYNGISGEYRIGSKLPLKPLGPFNSGHLERDLLFLEKISDKANLSIPLLKAITETNLRIKKS
jgi:UDPglucose 6-dehydrogenase